MGDPYRSVRTSLLVAVVLSVLTGVAVGWHIAIRPQPAQVTMVVDMPVTRTYEDYVLEGTPYVDGLIEADEWDRLEAEGECLWEYLVEHVGRDMTLEAVWAAGIWTDQLGGACAAIGRDHD